MSQLRLADSQIKRRRGFSVLELVVAMTLGLVLLSAVWTMFSIFTRQEELDRIATERSQLVRGLHQILSRDLANIVLQSSGSILPSIPSDDPASSYPIFPFAFSFDAPSRMGLAGNDAEAASLVGSRSRLQLVVFNELHAGDLQADAPETRKSSFFAPEPIVVDWPFTSIVYEFVSAPEPSLSEGEPDDTLAPEPPAGNPGLSRRESFLGSRGKKITEGADAIAGLSQSTPKTGNSLSTNPSAAPLESNAQIISEETVSEFTDLEFEYFDGTAWRDRWDSRESGALPAAIRVGFNLHFEKTPRVPKPMDEQQGLAITMPDTEIDAFDAPQPREYEFVLIVGRELENRNTSFKPVLPSNSAVEPAFDQE